MPSFSLFDLTDIEAFSNEEINKFDCVASSLVFHHLKSKEKYQAFGAIMSLLKPNGRLIIVDWGPGANVFLKLGFWFVRLFDGFAVTRDNAKGHLPDMIRGAGFVNVQSRPLLNTFFGTIWLHQAEKQTL